MDDSFVNVLIFVIFMFSDKYRMNDFISLILESIKMNRLLEL